MFKVSKGNSKLGNIYNINLPAVVTCASDAPCKKDCYACKGFYRMPSVKKCYDENLKEFKNNKILAYFDILNQLPEKEPFYCRIHSSGDFYNKEYLELIMSVAKHRPNGKFLAFTKKYNLINDYMCRFDSIPDNVKIIFSGWNNYPMYNPYNFPTAWVKEQSDDRLNIEAFPCAGHCENCYMCWHLMEGMQVVFNKH